jgi:N-methylhydantoinase B/oxoprolinase/acetone carboxylase alpha subunit
METCVTPQTLSILSERRVLQPYGLEGGAPGACGHNMLMQKKKKEDVSAETSPSSSTTAAADFLCKNLGGKNTVDVGPGDRCRLLTPGGGGFGTPVLPL